MNKLPLTSRVSVLRCLTEGNSLRSTSRITGVAFNTVVKLLIDAGRACAEYQHRVMKNLSCRRLQLDEIWAFVYAKQANIPEGMENVPGIGSIWTWIALDADTKLVPSYLVGLRDSEHARAFVDDLAGRLANRVQITTDGLRAYVGAIDSAFEGEVDYAILHKIYGTPRPDEARYSPSDCLGCDKKPAIGNPDMSHASTSFIERQNLTLRMRNRRFTRLTNAFSKKIENHEHAIALYFFAYNFLQRHATLRMPPALFAGVTDHLWGYEELVELIDRHEIERKRGEFPN